MTADYDLVVLGGTIEGRKAARQAASYGARIALVEPPGLFLLNQRRRYLLQALQQVTRGHQAQAVSRWFAARSVDRSIDKSIDRAIDGHAGWNWGTFLEWGAIATETQNPELSVAAMSAGGIDVVLEMPEQLSQKSIVTTRSRRIKARAVLAAFGLSPDVFKPLLTATQLPKTVMVWGGGVRSLLWAEALAQIGATVTLQTAVVLPGWDEGVRGLVRSQLTQSGVTVLDPADVNLAGVSSAGANLANANSDRAECTLFFGTEQPALTLPRFAYRQSHRRRNGQSSAPFLSVNRKLQVGKSRLFAWGPIVEGHRDIVVTDCDISTVVQNALFLPTRQLRLNQLVKAGGRFAMAGLTQAQAVHRYGDRVRVWQANRSNGADLSRVTPLPSYCQLVCVGRRLVGVHLVGDRAADCILVLSTYLNQPIAKLCNALPPASTQTLLSLVHTAASQYRQTQWKTGRWKRDWSENWFNWRRSR
ncbi:MAG: FAD-dependent oxidoreductase [Cyanobacteria bacterium P01_D01_bin.1]